MPARTRKPSATSRWRTKPPLGELHEVNRLKAEAEKELSGKGRVVLRYSGTEPKIRLLIEGPDMGMIGAQADRIAEAIPLEIGVGWVEKLRTAEPG